MSTRSRAVGICAALLLAGAAVTPATAHESDPQVRTELISVRPALPAEVVLQAQESLAPQLVADNPTDVELDVLDIKGQPFLRLSRQGVFANLESLDFYTTNNFSGSAAAAPSSVLARTEPVPPRWVQLSRGSSWGWFDHRLDVEGPPVRDRSRPAEIGKWEVPLTYGGKPVSVRGLARFEPLRGAFDVTVDPAPAGVTAQVLQGRLPGLFVGSTGAEPLTVLDREGATYVRLSPAGSALNVNSRLHVEDQRARGAVDVPLPSTEPRLEPLSGSTRSWLDSRLQYAAGAPPERALSRDEPTVLDDWRIPVLVGSKAAALTGQIRWVPSAVAEQAVRPAAPADDDRAAPVTVAGGGVLAVLGAVLLLRRRARQRRA